MKRAVLCIAFVAASVSGGLTMAGAQDFTPAACSAQGRLYKPGDVACIPACHGQQRLAKCEQTGSGVSWTSISDSCPSASIKPMSFGAALAANARLSLGEGPSLLR